MISNCQLKPMLGFVEPDGWGFMNRQDSGVQARGLGEARFELDMNAEDEKDIPDDKQYGRSKPQEAVGPPRQDKSSGTISGNLRLTAG